MATAWPAFQLELFLVREVTIDVLVAAKSGAELSRGLKAAEKIVHAGSRE